MTNKKFPSEFFFLPFAVIGIFHFIKVYMDTFSNPTKWLLSAPYELMTCSKYIILAGDLFGCHAHQTHKSPASLLLDFSMGVCQGLKKKDWHSMMQSSLICLPHVTTVMLVFLFWHTNPNCLTDRCTAFAKLLLEQKGTVVAFLSFSPTGRL